MVNFIYCLQSPENGLYLTVLHPENNDSPVDFFAEPHFLTWDKNTHFEIIENDDHILIKNGDNFLVNKGDKLKLSSNSEASPFKSVVNDNVTTFINIESGKAFDVVVINFDIILGLHQNLLTSGLPDFMKDMADIDTTKKYLIKFKNIDAVITPGQNATKNSPIRLFGTVDESNNCFNYSYFEFEKKTMGPPGVVLKDPVYFYYIKKSGTDLYMQWVTPKSDDPKIPDKTKAYKMFLGDKQDTPGATGAHPDFFISKGSDGSYRIKNFYQHANSRLNTDAYLSIDKEKKEQNAAVAKVDSVDEFEIIPIENVKVENFRSSLDPKSPNFKILVSIILVLILVLIMIMIFID